MVKPKAMTQELALNIWWNLKQMFHTDIDGSGCKKLLQIWGDGVMMEKKQVL